MKRFKNILLYLHGEHENDASLERAAALASENNAALKVVEVQEYSTSHATSGGGEMAWDRHFLERTEYLDRAIAPIRDQGISVSAQVLLGTPFVEVIRLVQRFGYDLVMTTAEGQGGLREALFGTTTTKLLRKCPCPVWVIKATHGKQYRCVLAAVTPCPGEETEKAALNHKIIELAYSLAKLENSELHIVQAWLITGELAMRQRLKPAQIKQIVRDNEVMYRIALSKLVEKYWLELLRHEVHLVNGVAAEVIPNLAEKKQVELIVMGTVGRAGIPGLIMGNTAEEVLRRVDCSVLAVKPDGFVSPLKLDKSQWKENGEVAARLTPMSGE